MNANLDLVSLDLTSVRLRFAARWGEALALSVEQQYRLFLVDPDTIRPSSLVDEFWHLHILDTERYAADCNRLFGTFLHHIPEGKKGRCKKGMAA